MFSFRHLFGFQSFGASIPFLFDTIRFDAIGPDPLAWVFCVRVQVWLQSKMVHHLNGDCHWISSATQRIPFEQIAYLFSIWNGRDALLNEDVLCCYVRVRVCLCLRVYKILYKCYYYDECDSEKCEWRFSVYYGHSRLRFLHNRSIPLEIIWSILFGLAYANRTLSIIVYLYNVTICVHNGLTNRVACQL